jgi:WD40 repeat protein
VGDADAGKPLRTLTGLSRAAGCVAISPDGARVAAAHGDAGAVGRVKFADDTPNDVKVWDAATGKEVLTLKGHEQPISAVAFSPDGKLLVSASLDGSVRLWNAASGKQVRALPREDRAPVRDAAFRPDGKALAVAAGLPAIFGGGGGEIELWDLETGRPGVKLRGHTGPIDRVAFRPDGRRLASAGDDFTVRVWDWAAGPFPGVVEGRQDSFLGGGGLAFSPDGRRLVWGNRSPGGGGQVLDPATGKELLRFGADGEEFHLAAYHPDGRTFVAVSDRSGMGMYDAATGKSLRALARAGLNVQALAFSPDGKRLATAVAGDPDDDVRVWDTASWKVVLTVPKSGAVAFSPDGKRLAVRGEDRAAHVHDAETGREVLKLSGPAAPIDHLAYSPDGKRLVTWEEVPDEDLNRNRPGVPRLWDAETGRLLLALKGHTLPVTAAAFGPGGRLLTGSDDKTVRVWDVETGQELIALPGHDYRVTAVLPSPDGRALATEVGGDWLVLRTAPSPGETAFLAHQEPVAAVAFSPDGTRLLTAPLNAGLRGLVPDSIKVWDARTGEPLPQHEDATAAAWAPDGKHLALGQRDGTDGADGMIVLRDLAAGKAALTLKQPGVTVRRLAFSPDGSRLASYAVPNAAGALERPATIKVWDVRTGKEERTLRGPKGGPADLTFNRDGSRLLALVGGEGLKVWEAATGRELPVPRPKGEVVGAAFSPTEDLLALAGEGGVSLWDAAGKEVRRLKADPGSGAVAFSRDGRYLAADAGGGVRVWEVATGRGAADFPAAPGSVLSLAFSPDGRWLVAGRDDRTAVRWELPATGRR